MDAAAIGWARARAKVNQTGPEHVSFTPAHLSRRWHSSMKGRLNLVTFHTLPKKATSPIRATLGHLDLEKKEIVSLSSVRANCALYGSSSYKKMYFFARVYSSM